MTTYVISGGSQTIGSTSDQYIVEGTGQLTVSSGANVFNFVATSGGRLIGFVDECPVRRRD